MQTKEVRSVYSYTGYTSLHRGDETFDSHRIIKHTHTFERQRNMVKIFSHKYLIKINESENLKSNITIIIILLTTLLKEFTINTGLVFFNFLLHGLHRCVIV